MIYTSWLFVALFFFISMGLLSSYNSQLYGQFSRIEDQYSTLYYGCQDYSGVFHCDRLHNKFESFKVKSSSSTIYHATDTPMFVEGKDGMALQMYANRLKSTIFSNTSQIFAKEFSIAFWVKGIRLPDDTHSPDTGHVLTQVNPQVTSGWSFNAYHMRNISRQTVSFAVFNEEGKAFSPPEIPIYHDNSFTHIVGTFDGKAIKVYRDGTFFGETKFNGTYDPQINTPLTIGVASGDPMQLYWTGNIDDLRYYDKAISISAIKEIYDIGNSDTEGSSSNLLGHWNFNGNLNDTSGNNHHGRERTLISSMVFAPDGRLFFSEKDTGHIKVMKDEKVNSKPFATISNYYSNWEQGLLGLAIDPDFKNNHFIYLFYTSVNKETGNPFNRIIRFTDVNSLGTNTTTIMDNLPASKGYHSGGAMAFGPDEKLYVTVGDATRHIECGNLPNSTGAVCPAQNSSNLLGKVLRINKDGNIPADNPYVDSPVYNIGHLNMYGLAFDKTGFGLVSENGDWLYDEINTLEKGANYGSPTLQPFNIDPEFSRNSSTPLRSYYDPSCLTQMIYYDGNKIPQLTGKFLVGTLSRSNPIFALDVDGIHKQIVGEEAISLDNFPNNQVVALANSPTGEIYYASYDINKLESIESNSKSQIMFPIEINLLSSTSDIAGVAFIPTSKEIKLNFESKERSNNTENYHISSNSSITHLKIDIPKNLLDRITAVQVSSNYPNKTGNSEVIDFAIKDVTTDNEVSLSLPYRDINDNYEVSIIANKSLS